LNAFSFLRLAIAVPLLLLFLWAQVYWFRRFWQFASRVQSHILRGALRALMAMGFVFVATVLVATFFVSRRDLIWGLPGTVGVVGLWITTAFMSWVLISLISGIGWIARRARRVPARTPDRAIPVGHSPSQPPLRAHREDLRLDRRRFVQGATALAGAIPFGTGAYGFLIGRHNYRVHQVDLPISGLPQELDGLRIAQLSDIHIGSYMSAAEVRRAVGLANELRPDLAVVTGDFVTGPNDPLESCVSELAGLQAPLGVWGCNGNHEIFAKAEEKSAELFADHGMKLLRQENAELSWRGGKFNLIGVDYQLGRTRNGHRMIMLARTGALVRRDIPNILLSHNPNSFPRAAELGIELMLTGHTHGGQVRVEILDHEFSPAHFMTPYVAGLYKRPLGCDSTLTDEKISNTPSASPAALVYVNRGLGTIGAPIRLGVPPEISLLILRSASKRLTFS
jgi:predicted MPP superfamily phosphohydrolase